jgi:hypothetical protein
MVALIMKSKLRQLQRKFKSFLLGVSVTCNEI